MLQSKEGYPQARIKGVRYAIIMGALLGVAVMVAPLNVLAQPSGPRGEKDRLARRAEDESAPQDHQALPIEAPFDISYVQPQNDGVVAVRLAKVLSQPELHGIAELLQTQLCEEFAKWRELIPPDMAIGLAQVEQITGPVDIHVDPTKPEGQRGRLTIGLSFCRTTVPYDWVGLIKTISPEAKVVDDGTRKRLTDVKLPYISPWMTYFVADERSISCPSGFHGKEQARAPSSPAQENWPDAWDYVKDADVAVVLDNRDNSWGPALDLAREKNQLELEKDWQYAAVAVELDEDVQLRVMFKCHDADAARQCAQTAAGTIDQWSRTLASAKTGASQTVADILGGATTQQHEATVTISMKSQRSVLLPLIRATIVVNLNAKQRGSRVADTSSSDAETERR